MQSHHFRFRCPNAGEGSVDGREVAKLKSRPFKLSMSLKTVAAKNFSAVKVAGLGFAAALRFSEARRLLLEFQFPLPSWEDLAETRR